MATILAGFRPQDFLVNSGALAVKVKAPQIIGSSLLGSVPVLLANIRRRVSVPTARRSLTGNPVGMFFEKSWVEQTHLQMGNALVGWSQNPAIVLGNVLTQKTQPFQVYNARQVDPIRITGIVLDNADGITIDDPSQPDFVNNRTPKVYELTISPSGPPVISATITITTDQGETFVITLGGSRTIVVPFLPQKGVAEGQGYKTWIIEHKQGTEQRQGFRDVAIQSLGYEFLNTERISSYVENLFYLRAGSIFGVPYHPGSTRLTTTAAAGALNFTVANAADKGFRQGDEESLALLWTDEFTFEAVRVVSIVGNLFTIQQELLATWPADSAVFPLRRGYAKPPRQQVAATRVRTLEIGFDIIANFDTPDASGYPVYDSLPVFDEFQLSSGAITRTFDGNPSSFDPETAPPVVWTDVRSPAMTWGFFRRYDRLADLFKLRDFFMDRQGRRLPFWMQTGIADFQILNDRLAGTQLELVNAEAAQMFNGNTSLRRQNIAITYRDGSVDYRQVLSLVNVSTDREDMQITPASSQALSAANVANIAWLVKVRFASDRLSIDHTQRQQSQVGLSVTDLDE